MSKKMQISFNKVMRVKKIYTVGFIVSLFISLFYFQSCDMPDISQQLDKPKPGVWAVFSPMRLDMISISSLRPIEDTIKTGFLEGAELELSWMTTGSVDTSIQLRIVVEEEYYKYYTYHDIDFRIEPGVTYTFSGKTDVGDFSDTFIVPEIPEIELLTPEIAYYTNGESPPFSLRVSNPQIEMEYHIDIEWIWWGGETFPVPDRCPKLQYNSLEIASGIDIPWCNFPGDGKFLIHMKSIEPRCAEFYDFLDNQDYGGLDAYYLKPPENHDYIGIIGAYTSASKAVWVEAGSTIVY